MDCEGEIAKRNLGCVVDGAITGLSSSSNEMEMYSNVYEQIPHCDSEVATKRNCSYNSTEAFRKEVSLSPLSDLKRSEKKTEKHWVCPILCFLVISIVLACVAAFLSMWSFLEVRKMGLQPRNCSCVNTGPEPAVAASNSSYVEIDTFLLWNENITQSISALRNEMNAEATLRNENVDRSIRTLQNKVNASYESFTHSIRTLQSEVNSSQEAAILSVRALQNEVNASYDALSLENENVAQSVRSLQSEIHSSYVGIDTFFLWNENNTQLIRSLQNELNSSYVQVELWNESINQLIRTLQNEISTLYDTFSLQNGNITQTISALQNEIRSSYVRLDTFSIWSNNITQLTRNSLDEVSRTYVGVNTFALVNESTMRSIGALRNEVTALSSLLQDSLTSIPMYSEHCGPGLWKQVVSLDMSDSSQHCPSEWRQHSSPVRSCSRPYSAPGCNQTSFAVGTQYSRVCGRVIARTRSSTDAFETFGPRDDENYVDGLSVTHSSPRQHIWTFAADQGPYFRCPCNGYSSLPPSFVGNDYFCDTDANGDLWDGEGCVTGLSCCTFNSPPWFSTQLPSPTSDDIDIRICTDEEFANENIFVELMEFYVQ